MESDGPGSRLTFDYVEGIVEYPHLSHLWKGVRKGGPKEKRLRKVISTIPDTRKESMAGLRLENVLEEVEIGDLERDFSRFGSIGDIFRPTMQHDMRPAKYVFIRFHEKGSAEAAMEALQGAVYHGAAIRIKEAKQESFFTNDTGYITNEALDTPLLNEKFFDSSLPKNHYSVKRTEALKTLDEVYAIRVADLDTAITPENLREIFAPFGEIASIYYPFDLRARAYRGFAFIRYVKQQAAANAWQSLDGVNLGVGRNITITPSVRPRYFGQDESA